MDWSDCFLVTSDPEVFHGKPVLRGTRIPAETVVENVEAFLSEGLSLDEALGATLECFPGVPEGVDGVRALLAYCDNRESRRVA